MTRLKKSHWLKSLKKEESVLILLTLVLLVILGGALLYFDTSLTQKNLPKFSSKKVVSQPPTGSVHLVFDFGGFKREFTGGIYKNTTLYAAFLQAAQVGKINILTRFDKTTGKVSVIGINGYVNTSQRHWSFYVNKKATKDAINQVMLKAGDEITARYE